MKSLSGYLHGMGQFFLQPLSLRPRSWLLWSKRVGRVSMWVSVPMLILGLGWGLLFSPVDHIQGYSARMMYIHVPSAYIATLGYGVMALAGLAYLLTSSFFCDLLSRSIAPVGLVFSLVCLSTGSIWGKPTWGVYWVWDARLTSMLLLALLYTGYILLMRSYGDSTRGAYAIAALSVVGALNLPVIKFSVEWWNTLHQPASLIRLDGPSIHGSMLAGLLFVMVGMTLFSLWMVSSRLELLLLDRLFPEGAKAYEEE